MRFSEDAPSPHLTPTATLLSPAATVPLPGAPCLSLPSINPSTLPAAFTTGWCHYLPLFRACAVSLNFALEVKPPNCLTSCNTVRHRLAKLAPAQPPPAAGSAHWSTAAARQPADGWLLLPCCSSCVPCTLWVPLHAAGHAAPTSLPLAPRPCYLARAVLHLASSHTVRVCSGAHADLPTERWPAKGLRSLARRPTQPGTGTAAPACFPPPQRAQRPEAGSGALCSEPAPLLPCTLTQALPFLKRSVRLETLEPVRAPMRRLLVMVPLKLTAKRCHQ